VTGKREKCAVTPGVPATIALIRGSSAVLDDGVNIPSKVRFMRKDLR
jgi:hypothetical protein